MTEEQKKKVREIAEHYGIDTQSEKTVEECAELIVAIKHMNKKNVSIDESVVLVKNLATEIADVMIMCEQLAYLYCFDVTLENQIDFKISRQLDRMEKGE